jgi:hypothetical protein
VPEAAEHDKPGLPRLPVAPREGADHASARAVIDDAKFHELASLLIGDINISVAELGRRTECAPSTVRKMMRDDRFQRIYERLRDDHIERRTDYILDERQSVDRRLDAARERGVTAVAEVVEEVRKRVKGGAAKASEMKVAVDAGFGLMDRAPGGRQGASGNTFVFAPTFAQAKIIRAADNEAGLDMSDVMDGSFEVVDEGTDGKRA